jgi:hypothetical protein
MGKRELAQIIAAQEWHDPTKWVERERDQFKESDDESERSCGEKKKNNNNKKKKMGKRELAQIIAAQEWHDPTKWVSKKNKREENAADEKCA